MPRLLLLLGAATILCSSSVLAGQPAEFRPVDHWEYAAPEYCPMPGFYQQPQGYWSYPPMYGGGGQLNQGANGGLPRGRRYLRGRYFGSFNNRYYGPQYGYF